MNASETLNPSSRGWWAWAGTRLRRPPPIGQGLLQILLLLGIVWLGVAGWCALANRSVPVIPLVMMPLGVNASWNDVGGMFVAPALYIAAWQALSFTSLRRVVWGGLIGAGLCLAGFILTGIITLLAFPVALLFGLACAVGIAKWLAWQDKQDAGEDGSAGQAAHVVGLSVALLGLPFAWLGVFGWFSIDSPHPESDLWVYVAVLLPITLLCLPHAVLTRLLRRPRHPSVPLIRAAALVLPLWALPAALLGATWPLTLHTEHAAQRAAHRGELRRFRDSGLFGLGYRPGERVALAAPSGEMSITVPEGWLGLHYRHLEHRGPRREVRLGRDAAAPAGEYFISRLTISPGEPPPLRSGPDVGPTRQGHAPSTNATRFGLVSTCRPPGDGAAPTGSVSPTMVFRHCSKSVPCLLRLPLSHGLEAFVLVQRGEPHRCQDARLEAAQVLRAASGLEIVDDAGLE